MSRSGRGRSLLLAALLAATPPTLASAQQPVDDIAELEDGLALLGLFVQGEERDVLDVIVEDGRMLLPADQTFDAIGASEGEGGIVTPIGERPATPDAFREVDGLRYVTETFLEDELSVRVRFDAEVYGVMLDVPWGEGEAAVVEEELVPDFGPGPLGVTSFHGDIFASQEGLDGELGVESELTLNGHALGGVWRLRYAGADEEFELGEYVYLRELDERLWAQVGRQQVAVHPLTEAVDMTGAQVAWTNKPRRFDALEEVGGTLLDRAGGAGRRFVGDGPPGGRVLLVIDGEVAGSALIDVNGVYEIESPLIGDRRNEVELRIFEPLSGNQVDTVRLSVTANDLIAPQGSVSVLAGAGVQGDFFDEEGEGGLTGFVRARYAPLDDLTLEASAAWDEVQGIDANLGAVAQLGRFGTAYAAAGIQNDHVPVVEGLYYGTFGRLDLSASGRWRGEEAARGEADVREARYDGNAQVGWTHSDRLRFGVEAQVSSEDSWVLPFASWRPRRGLWLSASPNNEGEYRFEAQAQLFRDVDLQVFYEGSGFARLTRRMDTERFGRLSMSLDANYGEDGGFGGAAGLSGERFFGADLNWRLRAAASQSSMGLSAGLSRELRPGLSLYADGGVRMPADDDTELFGTLGITFDYGFAGGTLAPAPRRGANPRFGQLGGRLVVPAGMELTEEDLQGARIVVDGRAAGRLNDDGTFWIQRVRRGVRQVRLEADSLPIDLVVDVDQTNAKVAPGAVTSLQFELAVETGGAGRVRGPDGEPVPGIRVVVLDADGEQRARAFTNQFGLYRVDGLRPGSYTLTAGDASRQVDVGSEYLFGLDLTLESLPEPAVEDDEAPAPKPKASVADVEAAPGWEDALEEADDERAPGWEDALGEAAPDGDAPDGDGPDWTDALREASGEERDAPGWEEALREDAGDATAEAPRAPAPPAPTPAPVREAVREDEPPMPAEPAADDPHAVPDWAKKLSGAGWR